LIKRFLSLFRLSAEIMENVERMWLKCVSQLKLADSNLILTMRSQKGPKRKMQLRILWKVLGKPFSRRNPRAAGPRA